jgi:hypothetical protein
MRERSCSLAANAATMRNRVDHALENEQAFRRRINARAQAEEEGLPGAIAGEPDWFIGDSLRRRGSLLSDGWTGPAAALANRGQIGVFPAMGWWRNRPALHRFGRSARYALLISIEAPEVTEHLYPAVQQKVAQIVPIEVGVG